MSETINKRWLNDKPDGTGNKIAPRTITTAIQDEQGNPLQDYIDSMIVVSNENSTEIPEVVNNSSDDIVTFESGDTTVTEDITEYTEIPVMSSGETHKSLFAKISTMFKNIRYLFKMLGTTDISSIGDGTVTGGISTINNSKQATITGGATTITSSNLTTNRALVSNDSGKVAVSAVTSTELGYLDGVTSAIQTQIDDKASKSGWTASRVMCSNGSGNLAVSSSITTTELGYLNGVTSNIQTQLNNITSNVTSNNSGVSLFSYNSKSKMYTCPSDGYLFLNNWGTSTVKAYLCNTNGESTLTLSLSSTGNQCVFCKKGQKIFTEPVSSTATIQCYFTSISTY